MSTYHRSISFAIQLIMSLYVVQGDVLQPFIQADWQLTKDLVDRASPSTQTLTSSILSSSHCEPMSENLDLELSVFVSDL